tara:strand:- start:142 stop:627 length:486 start_codon:yes stop_codon:yes gene_type:complete
MSWITCGFGDKTKAYRDGISFLFSAEDYEEFVDGYRFQLNKYGYVTYSGAKDGLNGKFLHRIIMDDPEGQFIDHINRDPLDNRRDNLRIVTRQENNMNLSIKKNNKSGITGVHWHKGNGKWVAQIKYKNKKIYLGIFEKLEAARKARKDAEMKYFGEFRAM